MRRFILIAAVALSLGAAPLANEPLTVVGTVVREFDGHAADNVLGYSLDSGTMSFDLILSRPVEETWLKDHFGKVITVVGERGRRGYRDYLFVRDMTSRP
jgi:hypothetical protein